LRFKTKPPVNNGGFLTRQLLLTPTRTLHRQLKEEGASLQQLKDSVRQAQAQALLLRSTRAIQQIALQVGFQSEKSFSRAFKTWTGQTPEECRRARPNPLA
jgi:AraC-like DNA-binding protein